MRLNITRQWRAPLIGLVLFAFFLVYILLPASLRSNGEVYFRVMAGSGARTIGRNLQEEHIVRSADVFALWAKLLGAQGKLQAGDYKLHPGMTPPQIVWRIKYGKTANAGVTIPEGYTLAQIAEALVTARLVDKDEFLALARDTRKFTGAELPFDPPTHSLEGYLFPDTYKIAPGTSAENIILIMLNRTKEKVLPLLEKTPLPKGFNLHKLLTMASIVEGEAKVAEERPLIAGVFYNRLRLNMPLQSDPTVKYVLNPAPLRLSTKDIAVDSPYNTYRYKGLPPGPISNPGLAAIQAALAPAKTEYLYFVARGDGSHIFSKTFQAHVAARKSLSATTP